MQRRYGTFACNLRASGVELSARLCYNIDMKVNVYAKLNMTLRVGQKQGAFHSVDSLVTSVDVADVVEVTARQDADVTLLCDLPIDPASNSAYRAAVAFMDEFHTSGVDIAVRKGIPVGAGMGGSSADAAAVVYCMCKFFGADVASQSVHELCSRLGSDVNFMLRGGYARMRGKGDDLTFMSLNKPLYFALTTFGVGMSTAEVYAKFDEIGAIGDGSYNDLQKAVRTMNGYAEAYIDSTRRLGYEARMTGSGSAYFIAFEGRSQAESAVRRLLSEGFDSRLCRSVSVGIEEIP